MKDKRFEMRVGSEELVIWLKEAKARGIPLSEWIHEACVALVRKGRKKHPEKPDLSPTAGFSQGDQSS